MTLRSAQGKQAKDHKKDEYNFIFRGYGEMLTCTTEDYKKNDYNLSFRFCYKKDSSNEQGCV